MSDIQLYKIIVRCERRDGPPRPTAHHVTGRLKKDNNSKVPTMQCIIHITHSHNAALIILVSIVL